MSKIKNSKFKNTGILFELLVRQVSSDLLSNKDSKAAFLIKKYFVNTELAKERILYQNITERNSLSELKANNLIETTLNLSQRLNRNQLRNEKYNLISDIKESYDVDDFFKAKIDNYKSHASLFNLIESHNSTDFVDPNLIQVNRNTLLESLTVVPHKSNNILEEFKKYDHEVREQIHNKLVEGFNETYSDILPKQKLVLSEYIKSVKNSSALKEFLNECLEEIKESLLFNKAKVKDNVTLIKLNEVIDIIKPIDKSKNVNEDDVLNVMNYYQLENDIKIL